MNVDWLLELPDDLDMCIAQRDFEGAVKLVEKGKKENYISFFVLWSPWQSTIFGWMAIKHRIYRTDDILSQETDKNPGQDCHLNL